MSSDVAAEQALQDAISKLVDGWSEDPGNIKNVFLQLKDNISGKAGVELDFKSRPGVSYSLRGNAGKDPEKEGTFFVMVDIIDDDPDNRWLSVCFYEEGITDPDEAGDLVPGGLFGMDGYCFDIYEYNESELSYLSQRIDEAYAHTV